MLDPSSPVGVFQGGCSLFQGVSKLVLCLVEILELASVCATIIRDEAEEPDEKANCLIGGL